MDTLAHGLYGAAVVASTKNEKLMLAGGIFGMLPDLIVQAAVIGEKGLLPGLKVMGGAGLDFPLSLVPLYRTTHSLVFMLILALGLFVFARKYTVLAVPYLLHILFDIFTHCGLFGTRIFFPFSNWHYCGMDYADSLWFWELNYGFLVAIYYVIYYKFFRCDKLAS